MGGNQLCIAYVADYHIDISKIEPYSISTSLSLTSRSSQTQLALAWTAESGETKVLL